MKNITSKSTSHPRIVLLCGLRWAGLTSYAKSRRFENYKYICSKDCYDSLGVGLAVQTALRLNTKHIIIDDHSLTKDQRRFYINLIRSVNKNCTIELHWVKLGVFQSVKRGRAISDYAIRTFKESRDQFQPPTSDEPFSSIVHVNLTQITDSVQKSPAIILSYAVTKSCQGLYYKQGKQLCEAISRYSKQGYKVLLVSSFENDVDAIVGFTHFQFDDIIVFDQIGTNLNQLRNNYDISNSIFIGKIHADLNLAKFLGTKICVTASDFLEKKYN